MGSFMRYLAPAIVCLVAFVAVGRLIEELAKSSSSPLNYLPIPIVAFPLLWLLWTMPHYGDVTVSAAQITRQGHFGYVRAITREAVTEMVKVTVIDSSRYGPTNTYQLLLVGAGRRCLLILDADYDVAGLASELRVPVESEFHPIKRSELSRHYPGAGGRWARWQVLAGLGLAILAAVTVVLLLVRATTR
jgi:hypothetical protein